MVGFDRSRVGLRHALALALVPPRSLAVALVAQLSEKPREEALRGGGGGGRGGWGSGGESSAVPSGGRCVRYRQVVLVGREGTAGEQRPRAASAGVCHELDVEGGARDPHLQVIDGLRVSL